MESYSGEHEHCGCYFEDTNILRGMCPQPSIGNTTLLLMSFIELIFTSQCFLRQPCRRVKPPSKPERPEFEVTKYDFIVIGGGVGGSVITSRLSEIPRHSVLLLEAGKESPTITRIPAFAFDANGTSVDWQYETTPQKNACLATGGVCKWPRGKMLCGTACLSGLMYTRGSANIYNSWANDGNVDWSYADVLNYFKKSETNKQPREELDVGYHGFSGPLSIDRFRYVPDFSNVILKAAKELGFEIGDLNGINQTGFGLASIMLDDGVMSNPTKMYLHPVLHRTNLRVLLESHVVRILLNKNGTRAMGVEYKDKWGNLRTVFAQKEVIVAGGVVNTPQLLMLSGIGSARDLQKLNIMVKRDLPGVGKNVHHHVGLRVGLSLNTTNNETISQKTIDEYIFKRTGPLASTGITQVTGFFSSSYAKDGVVPDIQLYQDGFQPKCETRKNEHSYSNIIFRPIYLTSKCRGSIRLKSADPFDKPEINPNYLCDEGEIEALLEGVQLVKNLTSTQAFEGTVYKFDTDENEECAKFRAEHNFKQYWRCVLTHYTLGENHHGGSCKMGPSHDPLAVVDDQLRVHGIPNLRIMDASIMPTPINCNTIAPVVMIAEKGSDMIKCTPL